MTSQKDDKISEQIKEMQMLARKLQQRGRLVYGFQRALQTIEKGNATMVIIANDTSEVQYKKFVLESCKKRGIAVAQRLDKMILSRIFKLKERDAQALVIINWGERWSDVDMKLFQKWFV